MKNREMLNLKSVLLVVLILIINTVSFAQSAANFSGSWAFNESKSKLGEGGLRMISQKLTISQDEKSFSIERYFTGQDGEERKFSETFTLDGKESENTVFNTSKKSTANWSADKKSLTVKSSMVFERDGEKNEIKTVEVYSISEVDKTLSLDYQSTSSRGERKAILVYDKK
jgi:hypothetical protein